MAHSSWWMVSPAGNRPGRGITRHFPLGPCPLPPAGCAGGRDIPCPFVRTPHSLVYPPSEPPGCLPPPAPGTTTGGALCASLPPGCLNTGRSGAATAGGLVLLCITGGCSVLPAPPLRGLSAAGATGRGGPPFMPRDRSGLFGSLTAGGRFSPAPERGARCPPRSMAGGAL